MPGQVIQQRGFAHPRSPRTTSTPLPPARTGALDKLREIARGIHPAVLADGGLDPALKMLARRSAVPVRLPVRLNGRLPDPIEIAAYFVVALALTKVAKHARASVVDVQVDTGAGVLRVGVRDDGADLGRGSGLVGLKDRVEALGGRIALRSPPGAGTALEIALPLDDPSPAGLPGGRKYQSNARMITTPTGSAAACGGG